jgi:tetratricopeptide (TPR) repeat protein
VDLRTEAARRIAEVLADHGAVVLAEAQLPSWPEALAGLPDTAFHLHGDSPHPVGERLLSRVRDVWAAKGQLRPAVAATRGLVKIRGHRIGADHPDTLVEVGALGALADRAGRAHDARPLLEDAHRGLVAAVGPDDARVAIVAANLASHWLRQDRPTEAEALLQDALRIRRKTQPDSVGVVAAQLAELYLRSDRIPQAVPLLTEAWAQARRQFGPTEPRTVSRARVLAGVLGQLDRLGEAEPILRDLHQHAVEQGNPETVAQASFDLGLALRKAGKSEEGFRRIEEAVQATRRLGDPHPTLPERLTVWARLVLERRRADEAEGLLREALEAETRLKGETSVEVAVRYAELGRFVGERGRHAEALGWLEPATSLLQGTLGSQHPLTRLAAENLVELLLVRAREVLGHGDRSGARAFKERAESLLPLLGPKHPLAAEHAKFRI